MRCWFAKTVLVVVVLALFNPAVEAKKEKKPGLDDAGLVRFVNNGNYNFLCSTVGIVSAVTNKKLDSFICALSNMCIISRFPCALFSPLVFISRPSRYCLFRQWQLL